MDPAARDRLESDIRRSCEASAFDKATHAAVRGFGPEIYGFLVATLHDEQHAADAFSLFCEDVWRGLPTFRWQCTFRTWAYTVARHATQRLLDGARRRRRERPMSDCPGLEDVAVDVRTATQTFLRTAVKDKFALLRQTLSIEDQTLLVLRVDKRLDWIDIARVKLGDAATEGPVLTRESARLRKRFQLVKDRLKELAEREGLLETKTSRGGSRSPGTT